MSDATFREILMLQVFTDWTVHGSCQREGVGRLRNLAARVSWFAHVCKGFFKVNNVRAASSTTDLGT